MNDGWKFAESLLGVAAEALKARREAEEKGATSIPPSLLSENERRFRAELAEHLWWALGPSGGQATKHDLDAMLAEVVRANEDAMKWRNREVTATNIRDVALDEAAHAALTAKRQDFLRERHPERREYEAVMQGWTSGANAALDAVRALKSKPASAPALDAGFEATERKLYGYEPKPASAPAWRSGYDPTAPVVIGPEGTGPAPQPSGNSGELAGHESCPDNPCPGTHPFCEGVGANTQPVIHDFGWALARMREWKRVKLPLMLRPIHIVATTSETIVDAKYDVVTIPQEWLLATDWQVVE